MSLSDAERAPIHALDHMDGISRMAGTGTDSRSGSYGWDLQNSRDWLVVAIHQKSYHVGNLSPTIDISRDTT